MEEPAGDSGPSEADTTHNSWWPSNLVEKMQSISLYPQEECSNVGVLGCNLEEEEILPQTASQMLWETGMFDCRIPNGFYSVMPSNHKIAPKRHWCDNCQGLAVKTLKARFCSIPTPEELCALGLEGIRADAILVDTKKDKKLAKLKQFTMALVKGLSSNPALMIKKVAEVVYDFYGGPLSEGSPAKNSLEDSCLSADNHGLQLLGNIKNGLCRPRAILFKVLADGVGLKSKLLVGLQLSDRAIAYAAPYKHMSLLVGLNSTELLVDVMRSPGQLIPFSMRALIMYHISGIGESDSAENDSCDSSLEPNSPMFNFSDKMGSESPEQEEHSPRYLYPRKGESLSASAGPSLPNIKLRPAACIEGKLSLSRSEPDIANGFWRRSRRKAIAEQRTASSSPEHPLLRARGRSMLSGHRHSFGEDADSISASRSVHASTLETHQIRRKRSLSITPEISDDIVRAVRAMNEAIKQERLIKGKEHDVKEKCTIIDHKSKNIYNNQTENALKIDIGDQKGISRERATECDSERNSDKPFQRAVSVPSSPREFEKNQLSAVRTGLPKSVDMISSWNQLLQSSSLLCNPLLPYPEWNIEFSELRIGVRVGIGSFGEVFRGIWKGTEVAIKVLLEQDLSVENVEDFCNEISLLSRMRHPNVILFLGACTKPPKLSMVTEYMDRGSLYYLIHTSGHVKKLSWRRRLKMLRDICRGMMCIQRMNIIHRDLKSANCLVDKHWTVKICDFGLSRVMKDLPMRDSTTAGTPEWMAPELLRNEPFTDKCDVFSLGVILWELCTLKRPWEGVKPLQVVYAVAHEGARLEIPEGPIGRLISDCWADANDRPTYEEILTRLHECEFLLS